MLDDKTLMKLVVLYLLCAGVLGSAIAIAVSMFNLPYIIGCFIAVPCFIIQCIIVIRGN